MSTALVTGLEQSTPARYEALMRISNSIRARTESEDLFEILVHELGKVIQFDAMAQFESATKIRWHFGPVCRAPQHQPLVKKTAKRCPLTYIGHKKQSCWTAGRLMPVFRSNQISCGRLGCDPSALSR